ncbi:MAG TPA: endo alpha-1,4 polygalactosaminidase [Chloroflexota bacterium]|nr:endo alpha-1,4 polygalactosaminidase [Chloroflexota bacterium]
MVSSRRRAIKRAAVAALGLLLVIGAAFAVVQLGSRGSTAAASKGLPAPVICGSCWKPPLRLEWQWQLSGKLDTSIHASVYDVDMFGTSKTQVRALHRLGRRVICYIDAGTWENWRPDAPRFPKSVIGRPVQGWQGEWWLDVRRIRTLRPLISARVTACRQKGFDGVEFDNVDGYQNQTGFPLTGREQLRYDIFLANLAHDAGLSVALKNDTGQVAKLLPYFDYALDEQCFQYQECGALRPFVKAGKPVFEVEYSLRRSQFCQRANALNFNSMRKHLSLGPWRRPCS